MKKNALFSIVLCTILLFPAANFCAEQPSEEKGYYSWLKEKIINTLSSAFGMVMESDYDRSLSQEVQNLRDELQIDQDTSKNKVDTIGKMVVWYTPNQDALQDTALELIFAKDICTYLPASGHHEDFIEFTHGVLKSARKASPLAGFATFRIKTLKSLKSLLENACETKSIVNFLDATIRKEISPGG